jgi:catalase
VCEAQCSTRRAGDSGASPERDIPGFAMKCYTEEGNWNLVGNNTPVFFLRDPLKFPDRNHAVKRDPKTNLRSAKKTWDFWTSLPEALHQITIATSERGIPYSCRHLHGFGSQTFSFINAKHERFRVKFHLICQQGIKNLTDAESEAIIARDRLDGAADHWNHREDTDDYSQPGKRFTLMTAAQQQVLFENTARAMGDAPKEIKLRHIGNCVQAAPAYGEGVARALGIPMSEMPTGT